MIKKLLFSVFLINLHILLFSQNYNNLDTIPINILGNGELSTDEILTFFQQQIPDTDIEETNKIISLYIAESNNEGVNYEVAIAQMLLETGYLRFGGTVNKKQNNFCGLGTISANNCGHSFDSDTLGVRAHIQHLKAYATDQSLNCDLVDPRYHLVKPKGKSPTIKGLSGTWASDTEYAVKIERLIKKMRDCRKNYSTLL